MKLDLGRPRRCTHRILGVALLGGVLVSQTLLIAQSIELPQNNDAPLQLGSSDEDETPNLPATSDADSEAAPTTLTKDEAPAVLLQAAQSYEQGKYEEARQGYERLIDAGYVDVDLHYNLANSLLRSGELGRAVAEYRRALFLQPRDEDARANLNFARRSTKDAVRPPEPSPWASTLFFWHYGLSGLETLKALIAVSALFWLLLAIRLVRTSSGPPKWLLTTVVCAMIALAASLVVRWKYPERIAVVLPAQADVYSGTDLQSRVIFNLHAGTEVRILHSDDRWTQFLMPGDEQDPGWIPTQHVELVVQRVL